MWGTSGVGQASGDDATTCLEGPREERLHRPKLSRRRVVAVVLAGVLAVSTPVATSPAGAQVDGGPVASTQQVSVIGPTDDRTVEENPISLAADGRSVGWAQQSWAAARSRYWVLDQQSDPEDSPLLKSLDAPGIPTGVSGASHLSADGKTFVATYRSDSDFGSCGSSALPPGGVQYTNMQVIRWERATRTGEFGDPTLVSESTEGVGAGCDAHSTPPGHPGSPPLMGRGGNAASSAPSVSGDGSVVAFTSRASDLGVAPVNPFVDALYVRTDTDDIEMVTDADLDDDVMDPLISQDGQSIVFSSSASDVGAGPVPFEGGSHVYVATRAGPGTWTIDLVSKSSSGVPAELDGDAAQSSSPAISADGARVAFLSDADNLDPGVQLPEHERALYVHDRTTPGTPPGTTRAVLTTAASPTAHSVGASPGLPVLSADGLRVAVFARSFEAEVDSRLLVFDVDAALSSNLLERVGARLTSRKYLSWSNSSGHLAIAASGSGHVVAFPSWSEPLERYRGSEPALYFVGGGSIGPDVSRGWHGDPVDTATGNFRHDEVDLVAPVGSGPITLTRSYTSFGSASGVFGQGWLSDVDTRLDIDPDADAVTLQVPTGELIPFAPSGTGWSPTAGHRLRLEEGTGEWTIHHPDGQLDRFDEDGRLVSIEQPDEPTVTLTWTGETPATMSSASGYELTFIDDTSYNFSGDPVAGPDGLIDAVETSDGRRVVFGYAPDSFSGGTLVTASRPHAVGQAPGTYGVRTYEADGSLITRIVDDVDGTRERVVVENTYDSWGRVVHQVTATGDDTEFAYDLRPDLLGGWQDAPGTTTTTDVASGDVTVYEYNSWGEVVAVTDALGNPVGREWFGDQPAASVSRSGVETSYSYDAAGRVTEVSEAAGTSVRTLETLTYVVADSDPAARSDARVATRTDEAGVTTTYTYVGASRLPATVSVPCDASSTDPATPCPTSGLSTTSFTYFTGGLEGLVAEQVDPDGVVTEFTYHADRSLASSTTYDGTTPLITTYETLRPGDVGWSETAPAAVEVRVTETPGGAVTEEVFDAEGRVLQVRDPLYDGVDHLATVYSYRLDGELASVTDPAGHTITYEVDRLGDPGWAEAPEIAEVRTEIAPDGVHVISKVDRSGDVVVEQRGDPGVPGELATTVHSYGPLGRLELTVDPTGVETEYFYDVDGRVTLVADGDGEGSTTYYDDHGRPVEEIDALGNSTVTTYDAAGRVVEVEDRTGASTHYAYDAAGRLVSTTDARGGVTTRSYTPGGRLASETDPVGVTTAYVYDSAGRLSETSLPSGATTVYGYDADGRLVTETSQEGRVRTTTYDLGGRVVAVEDPASGVTESVYDAQGNLVSQTDATGGTVSWEHDPGGRVVSVTDPLGRETTYAYDSRGNRVLRVDALDGEREWVYDLADRLVLEVDPLERETTYAYDWLGRLEERIDGEGRMETYVYDAAGQVVEVHYSSGGPTTFEYDEEGRRTRMVDAVGETQWSYDSVGQLTEVDNPGDRDLAWEWDLAGRRTELTYPNETRFRNLYDLDGRLSEVQLHFWASWATIAVVSYDDDGLVVAQTFIDDNGQEWVRDPVSGRVVEHVEALENTPPRVTELGYDDAGRLVSEDEVGGTSVEYSYDLAGQLVEVERSVGDDEVYAYDELGRRTSSSVGAVTTTYQWDAASQLTRRVVGGDDRDYLYDDSGRRITETWDGGAREIDWTWDDRGYLEGQSFTSPSGVIEVIRATRGDGQLASVTTSVDGIPEPTRHVVWDETLGVAQPVWSGERDEPTEWFALYAADLMAVLCQEGAGCTGAVSHDVHGSALATPDTADVVHADAYDPWGGNDGGFAEDLAFGYRSELHTGAVVHLRNRDYDPATGLFLSPDPLDGVDGTTTVANPYHYTDNDPINKTDPLGLRPSDGSINDGQIGAACDAAGGRIIGWGDGGTRACLEPPISLKEGDSCWPPYTPGGNPIVWHRGSCAIKTTEITCARFSNFVTDVICRNSDTITTGLWIITGLALTVASAGGFAYAAASIGGGSGFVVATSSAGGAAALTTSSGGVAVSSAVLANLGIAATSTAGAVGAFHMAESTNTGGGQAPSNRGGSSARKMQSEVQRGQAPRGVERVDRGNPNIPGSQDHAHILGQRATLNRDGTWGHGNQMGTLTRPQRDWFRAHGWNV